MGRPKKNQTIEIKPESPIVERPVLSESVDSGSIEDSKGINQLGLKLNTRYFLTENGLIDWYRMIDPQFIVINKARFTKRGQEVPIDPELVAPEDKLVKLAAFKELAQLRGYTSVDFNALCVQPTFVSIKCTICWTPNFETGYKEVCFSATADAAKSNTNGFGSFHLTSIAENRAFSRAVRNFLRIHVASDTEVSGTDAESESDSELQVKSSGSPHALLSNMLVAKSLTFDAYKKYLGTIGFTDVEKYSTLDDIPTEIVVESIGRLTEENPKKT